MNCMDVLETVQKGCATPVENRYGVRVEVDTMQHLAGSVGTTPLDSEVVVSLTEAVEKIYGVAPEPSGDRRRHRGRVSCAKRAMTSAVWSTCVHNAHQPNEYSMISTQIKDSQVFARMLLSL